MAGNEIPEAREMVYIEDTRFRAAVSEAIMKKFGAIANFLFKRHIEKKDLYINGIYNGITLPFNDIDGGIIFEYPVEIVNVYIKNRSAGSGGTTELDIKWKPQLTGSWATIFGTTPKITSTAASNQMCGIGQTITGFTAAVLSKTQFDAGDMLRLDLLQAMTGNPNGCAIIIHYRPI